MIDYYSDKSDAEAGVSINGFLTATLTKFEQQNDATGFESNPGGNKAAVP